VADVRVERRGPSIWPWIIGLLVLSLLIWLLVETFGNDDAAREQPAAEQPAMAEPAPGVLALLSDGGAAIQIAEGQLPRTDEGSRACS
jgi:hypothetical protein